jgi:hypothetical protein
MTAPIKITRYAVRNRKSLKAMDHGSVGLRNWAEGMRI